jgi:hypothetical protein
MKWRIDLARQIAAEAEHLDGIDVVADMQRQARQDRAVWTVLGELAAAIASNLCKTVNTSRRSLGIKVRHKRAVKSNPIVMLRIFLSSM